MTARRYEPAKKDRTFKLQLTDGVRQITGFEYRHIPALKPDLPAGIKVRMRMTTVPCATLSCVPCMASHMWLSCQLCISAYQSGLLVV